MSKSTSQPSRATRKAPAPAWSRHAALVALAITSCSAAALSPSGDLDGDGRDEVLLRNASSGDWIYYDHATRRELAIETPASMRIVGLGDFDGDGADEVLARDIEDQRWRYFDLAESGIVERLLPTMTMPDRWAVDAIGDFNGDGTDDVLLRHDRGASRYYAMNAASATLVRNLSVTRDMLFDVVGAGDFNGDGHEDILMRHARNGRWLHYDMAYARGAPRRPGLTSDPLFQFEAIGDFNGDGRDDVLLRHADTGEWIYYAMRANHRGALTRRFGMPRDLAHEGVTAWDFDGDGVASPLLRHPDTGAWTSYDLTTAPAQRVDHADMATDQAWATTIGSVFQRPCAAGGCTDVLLRGVMEIDAPGWPGNLCLYGPRAFPVVVGGTQHGHAPVVAAGHWRAGRIVALGHDGYLNRPNLETADTGRLMTNALHWAAGQVPTPPRIGVVDAEGLRGWLLEAGHDAVAASLSAESLGAVDVVALRLWDQSDAEVAALAAFVRAGGGLVAAATGWGWLATHPGRSLATDFAGTRLLAPAGIGWADGGLDRTSQQGFAADGRPHPLTHPAAALAAIEAGETLTAAESAQATDSLVRAARCVPPDDELLRPSLLALAERNDLWPTATRPLTEADTVARIAATVFVESQRFLPAESVRAHGAAGDFPGAVAADAPRLSRSVSVDTSGPQQSAWYGATRWHSTGLYAAPGELVAVTLPPDAAEGGFVIRVGVHSDPIWNRPEWKRMPEISRLFPVSAPTTYVANAFGGLIYLEVPPDTGLGSIAVEIEGAVAAARFVLGETAMDAWRDEIRHAPGPWAEIEGRNMIVATESSRVRDLDDPAAVAAAWDRIVELSRELVSWPAARSGPERFVVDRQISVGYMHAGYPLMAFLDQSAHLVDAAYLSTCAYDWTQGNWGFRHEVGHNFQNYDWTFHGTTEVTVNLFTLYVYEFQCGIPVARNFRGTPEWRSEQMARYDFDDPNFEQWKSDPFLALVMYQQMQQAFGWDAYRRVFAVYDALPDEERPKSDDEKRDQWLVRFSQQVGRDLGPFFEAWGVPTSLEARGSISHLPTWMPENFPPQ